MVFLLRKRYNIYVVKRVYQFFRNMMGVLKVTMESKKIHQVEQHIISRTHPFFEEIDRSSFASKNLYNAANYLIRQEFIFNGKYVTYKNMAKRMQGNEDFQALPAKVAQQVLMQVDHDWKSFFGAIKAWQKHPEKFLGKP